MGVSCQSRPKSKPVTPCTVHAKCSFQESTFWPKMSNPGAHTSPRCLIHFAKQRSRGREVEREGQRCMGAGVSGVGGKGHHHPADTRVFVQHNGRTCALAFRLFLVSRCRLGLVSGCDALQTQPPKQRSQTKSLRRFPQLSQTASFRASLLMCVVCGVCVACVVGEFGRTVRQVTVGKRPELLFLGSRA